MASSSEGLTRLQRELLEAFFRETSAFFLTGGAALAAFHLHHRPTDDLDFFAPPAEATIPDGIDAVLRAAGSIGATASEIQRTATFGRVEVIRDPEATRVDLVIDPVPPVVREKDVIGAIRVDPVREIAANKLCTLLDRIEPRDLVDLKLLFDRGITLEGALADAHRKHLGADAATLAWVLTISKLPGSTEAIAGVPPAEVAAFKADLIARLERLALPRE